MSNIAFCDPVETWPDAAEFPLIVLSIDGKYGHWFTEHAEVAILGPARDRGEGGTLAICIRFPTLEQAHRAGQILADAFAAVREIEGETPPDPAACSHEKTEWMFFARSTQKWPVCATCGFVGEPLSIAEWRDQVKSA